MKDNLSFKDINSQAGVKDVDGKKGIVTGYFASFDFIDSDSDIIKKGAFAVTINGMGPGSAKPRIKHLLNHNPEQAIGVITSLKEDDFGLYYESQIGKHTLGKDFLAMAESGLITEHSIGFRTMKFNQLKPLDEVEEGEAWREITEVKLYEGSSLTAWGANENTPLTGLKSEYLEQLVNKAKKIDDFCRSSKATDDTIESLLAYNKQLLDSIKNLQTSLVSPNPAESVSPTESEVVIKGLPGTVECPRCKKITHNTMAEKSYIKCHRCSAVFVYGANDFMDIF